MPWLPLYLYDADVGDLLSMLNADPEIAFVVQDGPGRWIARRSEESLRDGRHCLWHEPSGALPLLDPQLPVARYVRDAWAGWTELKPGADPSVPYFGPGHPGVVWLNLRRQSRLNSNAIGLSSFEWIGNHYRTIGSPAPATTRRWWNRLRSFVKRHAVRIPREGRTDGPHPEIWAFPSALQQIERDRPRDANP